MAAATLTLSCGLARPTVYVSYIRMNCHHLAQNLTRVTNSPAVNGAPRIVGRHCGDRALPIPDRLGAAVRPSYYEIRVVGALPPEALLDYERLTASVEPVETVLHGPLLDQAALNGLLARLETLGVQILEVRRVHGQNPSAGEDLSDG